MNSADQRRGAPAAAYAMQWQMNSMFIFPPEIAKSQKNYPFCRWNVIVMMNEFPPVSFPPV
jgi:hypothetical protein